MYGAYLAWPVALTATLGSLYFSEIAGYFPCNLCWYQRILMYPLVLIILVGILNRDEFLPSYVLPFSSIGLVMALYHYLLQIGVIAISPACGTFSCGERYITYAGFITIPFLSLTAFTIITVIMGAMWWAYRQEVESE